ncbi:FAD binding domain-containing protein [Streptomyces sp. NPDC056161]|uniref:FAD binding domain-containing protein n=1 Tax=Streptomyces sp. NPDC056161 TaxID=3345732 RepID=UPI0035DF8082
MRCVSQGLLAPTQRTIPDFELRQPRTVAEAVAAGAAEGAVYAQGCTDLFAQFREGLDCATLVSLDKVAELREIDFDGATLTIGAAVAHHSGARHPAVVAALPGLAAGWRQIANHRIRQRATIGGNVMARRTRYEMSLILESLGAELEFVSRDGLCLLSVADVWDRRVPPGALLRAVTVPDVPRTWFGYERSLRPLLTVAATVRTESVRDGSTRGDSVRGDSVRGDSVPGDSVPGDSVRGDSVRVSVGSEMQRHFTVEAPLGTDPSDIAALLPDEIGDAVADAGYRRHAAGVLLRRLLSAHADRAARTARPVEPTREEDAR